MPVHGVGIDVADVDRVARLLDSYGDRFTGRWFTPTEIAEAEASEDPAAAFTARLATKEAVWKALRLPGTAAVPWAQIAVLGVEHGLRPEVELRAAVAEAAAGLGVGPITVSCSTSGRLVTAIAIAVAASRPRPPQPW